MNAVSMHMQADSGAQLHPFYSLAGAAFGTALVCTFLLWAFTHSLPRNVSPRLVVLHLVTLPTATSQRIVRTVSRQVRSAKHAGNALPVVIPKTSAAPPIAAPAPLDLGLPGITFAPPPVSSFIPHTFNPYSDLEKAIHTPPPPPTMQNGDSYRSVYGYTVVKSGGRCLALQIIQAGPSPSAHTAVGFGVPCPGEYRPSMADELKAWADKVARKHHAPS